MNCFRGVALSRALLRVSQRYTQVPRIPNICRFFGSTTDKKDEAPESNYNDEEERMKEFLDKEVALFEGGSFHLTNLPSKLAFSKKEIKNALKEQEDGYSSGAATDDDALENARFNDIDLDDSDIEVEDEDESANSDGEDARRRIAASRDRDGGDSDDERFRQEGNESGLLDDRFQSASSQYRINKEYPDELLHNFIPATSELRSGPLNQGDRACPGKLQRRGRGGELKCHKIDLDAVSYINVLSLKDYLSEDGEILGKRDTGLCSKCQRKVSRTIKHSRCMGLLPHIGQFTVSDGRPDKNLSKKFHDVSPPGAKLVEGKTVL